MVAFHGTEDTLIPFALGKRLVEAAPNGKLIPVPGRGHNDLDEVELLVSELSARAQAAKRPSEAARSLQQGASAASDRSVELPQLGAK